MNILITSINILFMLPTTLLFDFSPQSDLSQWFIIDDVVMGGRSSGQFFLNAEGNGIFTGAVSLENNGGFSSVHHRFPSRSVKGATHAVVRLRGDGKRYQFRVKTSVYDRHSYVAHFETTGEWQTIKIPLRKMYPTFRGRTLDMPDYPGETLAEIAFFIANKKAETFRPEIDQIGLEGE